MMILRIVVMSAAIIAHNDSVAEELCGRTFNSLDELYADVFIERSQTIRQPQRITIIDQRGNIWRFTQTIHPAAPAAACIRFGSGGERQQQLWCRAAQGCDTLLDGFPGTFERK